MPEAIISAKGTEAPTVRSGRFTHPILISLSIMLAAIIAVAVRLAKDPV